VIKCRLYLILRSAPTGSGGSWLRRQYGLWGRRHRSRPPLINTLAGLGLISSDSHCDIILDPAIIAKRYVRGWFAVDLVSSLPLDYAFWALNDTTTIDYSAGRALRILRLAKLLQLLRILRISRLVRYIKIWQEVSVTSATHVDRVK